VPTLPRAIFCELCGAEVGLNPALAKVHYCLRCKLFIGPECSNGELGRCIRCVPRGTEQEHRGEVAGILAARRAIRVLERLPAEAAALAATTQWEGTDGSTRLGELEVERTLLWGRAEAAASAVRHALARVAPRHLDAAKILGARSDAALYRLAAIPRPRTIIGPDVQSVQRLGHRMRGLVGRLPRSTRTMAFLGVLTGVIGVALVAATLMRPVENQASATAASGEPISRGQVAGGEATPPPGGGPAGQPGLKQSAAFRFDELVMGSALGPPWRVTKESGAVSVNPFPNAIQRSLALRTDARGPVTICHPIDARQELRATQASVDIYRPADGSAGAVTIQSALGVWGISIGPLGEVAYREKDAEPHASAIRLETGRWYRLSIALGAVPGEYSFTIADPSGGGGLTSHGPLPASTHAEPMQICIASAGEPNAELYLDNVVITG
jgi:hypothetical protein